MNCACVYVADLRWVQVSSAEEAYRVMKIGKKNQSFSATRLNQLSSRRSGTLGERVCNVPVFLILLQCSYTQHTPLRMFAVEMNLKESSGHSLLTAPTV